MFFPFVYTLVEFCSSSGSSSSSSYSSNSIFPYFYFCQVLFEIKKMIKRKFYGYLQTVTLYIFYFSIYFVDLLSVNLLLLHSNTSIILLCSPSGSVKNIENTLSAGRGGWKVMVFLRPKERDLLMLLMMLQSAF